LKVTGYSKPRTPKEAYELLKSHPKNQVIGGGAWLKLAGGAIETLISLEDLGLGSIKETSDHVFIGSMTTLRSLETSPVIQTLQGGVLAKAAGLIMGLNVRNIATIGGSVMGRFGFSDILTALLAIEAKLVFFGRGEIGLEAYLETRNPEKDILLAVKVPILKAVSMFHKESRTALDFAIINLAIVKSESKIMIAVGSRPQGPVLASKAMGYLAMRSPISAEDLEIAGKLIIEEIDFKDNLKASAEYRRHLAKVLSVRMLKAVMGFED